MRSAASLRATALITIVATGLVVPEVIQDTLFCEACDFLPVVAAMLDIDVLMTGGGGAGGRRKGGNLSAVLVSVGLLVLIALFVVVLTILNRIEHHVIKISDETELEVVADIIEATVTDSLQGLQRGLSRMSSSLNTAFFEEGDDEAKDDGVFKGIQRGMNRMSSTLKRSASTTFFKTTDDDDDDGDKADDDGDAQTGARAPDGDQELALQGDVTLVVRPDAADGPQASSAADHPLTMMENDDDDDAAAEQEAPEDAPPQASSTPDATADTPEVSSTADTPEVSSTPDATADTPEVSSTPDATVDTPEISSTADTPEISPTPGATGDPEVFPTPDATAGAPPPLHHEHVALLDAFAPMDEPAPAIASDLEASFSEDDDDAPEPKDP